MKDFICYYSSRKIKSVSDLPSFKIQCNSCGKALDVGDYLDFHFPYLVDECYCKRCFKTKHSKITIK